MAIICDLDRLIIKTTGNNKNGCCITHARTHACMDCAIGDDGLIVLVIGE